MQRLEASLLSDVGSLEVIDRLLQQLHGVIGAEELLTGSVDRELAPDLFLLQLFCFLLHLGDEPAVLIILHVHDGKLLRVVYKFFLHILPDEFGLLLLSSEAVDLRL